MKKALGIYVHIPFCVKKCGYCDFCSVADFSLIPEYITRLCADIREAGEKHGADCRVDTVYFGGGTPTCAGTRLIDALDAIRAGFELDEDAEISLEANPATADLELLKALRGAGFNRLSVGIQSADDGELKKLGRIHSFSDAVRTVAEGRAAGFSDVGGDMMLGIPDQTPESMARTVRAFAALGLDHVSAYMLKIEPDTPFGRNVPDGLPDEEQTAELYLNAASLLRGLGYERYEISNFAKPGFECRHNMKYWSLGDYLGFGPTAHSCFGGRRTSVEGGVAEYAAGRAYVKDRGPCGGADEYIMLALRTSGGVDLRVMEERYGLRFKPNAVISELEKRGFISVSDKITLSDEGVLLSNSVITELTEAFEPAKETEK